MLNHMWLCVLFVALIFTSSCGNQPYGVLSVGNLVDSSVRDPKVVIFVHGTEMQSKDGTAFFGQVQAIDDEIAVGWLPIYLAEGSSSRVSGTVSLDGRKISEEVLFRQGEPVKVLFGKTFFLKEGQFSTLTIRVKEIGTFRFVLDSGENNAYAVVARKPLSTSAVVGDRYEVSF